MLPYRLYILRSDLVSKRARRAGRTLEFAGSGDIRKRYRSEKIWSPSINKRCEKGSRVILSITKFFE